MQQYLSFELNDHLFAVGAQYVNSILDPQPWTPLPSFGTLVVGLVNVRGNVVPLVDPAALLIASFRGLPQDLSHEGPEIVLDVEAATEGGIVVLEVANGTLLPYVGLEVQKITGVLDLSEEHIRAVPTYLSDRSARFFEGFCLLGGAPFPLLRLEAVLSRESLFPAERPIPGGFHG